MTDSRPDPDELLARVKRDAANRKCGQLRIFFGYAAGVGKTYAMLENAHRALDSGKDVVIGYLEPHARLATQKMALGLETIAVRELDYRGMTLTEFNIDAALKRNSEILLVDELAHSNAEGSRHNKRWQDVQELLAAGIDVWTTLNVQHIESLNDIVGQVTGVNVRETVPDYIFESADEIELVDLPPDDLLARLENGQIYLPEQAKRAVQHFFKRSNLSALRELSLRQAATRVHLEVESARLEQTDLHPWATADRLLVCVGPSPTTSRVIRTAKRMATALDAMWVTVSVELPGGATSGSGASNIANHFRLAERLGAEVLTLAGDSVVDTILEYARTRNITKILIGKTNERRWKRFFKRSVVDQLIESSGGIDVYVIQGDRDPAESQQPARRQYKYDWLGYANAALTTIFAMVANYLLGFFRLADSEANRVMVFLAGIAFVAFRNGSGPAIASCLLSVLAFDFFFVPPFLTFTVSDSQYVVTFAVMLVIGLLVSTLASRLRLQISNSRSRERQGNSLYELGKELSSLYGDVFLVSAAARTLGELLTAEIVVYLKSSKNETFAVNHSDSILALHSVSLPAAQWVIEHAQIAGIGTNTLPNACALFVPLQGSQSCFGALAVRPLDHSNRLAEPESRRLLESGANQLALALERDRMTIDASQARLQAESEQLRSTVLSSVSHDLKTPLASILGASSSILTSTTIDMVKQRFLIETIDTEAKRLNRLLENILQMSRLDADAANPNMQWHVLEEIVGSALKCTSEELAKHSVSIDLPTDLPLIFVDDIMLEQVLINLLENAAKYTPPKTSIAISAVAESEIIRIRIRDRGPGIPDGLEERIFDKFHRANLRPDSDKGNGLGLAICKAIVKLLGGSISASNPMGGGAEFVIQLPQPDCVPTIESETDH